MKKPRIVKVNSSNGELHYILEEISPLDTAKPGLKLSEAKAKEIAKKDASKPLFLTRDG
jgi:hypothetical protein